MLDPSRLGVLKAIAAHGSMARAASALGYTPSAVSQQIAKLEREVRTELLDRKGSGAELTPAAWLLVEAADEIAAVLERAQGRVEALRGVPSGRLVLSAFPTACRGFVAAAVGELTRAHPELDCRLVELDPNRAIARVTRGEADVAVVHDWHNTPLVLPPSLSVSPVGEDVADVALPVAHPLVGRDVLTPEDLADERWISQGPEAMCHEWLTRTFRQHGMQPDIAYQVEEYESQVALLAAGLGVAMLPRLGRGVLPPGVRVLAMRPTPSRQVSAVWRARTDQRPAVRAVLDALRRHWSAGSRPDGETQP
ncbi:LysR family transcriptional regulator [Streptomyces silvisoli]|uniref:LysR family transcriptional regulator n=1 Tax=Streptomyces silvisoli TaxID=3034235 RepID=A0ABT5ZLY6_9ACTN|nr:LysR family transcriptional regulator [Streptomyces silvisoli]MDF3290691.1 LysR family transcriptional regulator [Streptomyces silvisoli]